MVWVSIINIFIILIFASLFFIFRRTDKKLARTHSFLSKVTNTINSVRYGNLSTQIEKLDHPTYQDLSDSLNRMVETLKDREQMIVEYQTELMHQNKFLETSINSLSDGILIIEEHYKILFITPQIEKWFKLTKSEIVGKCLTDLIQSKENIKIEELENSEIFVNADTNSTFEATSNSLVFDDRKRRFIVIIKNITDQKELETLKEDFFATLAHDLKVPIVAASNILDFLLEGKFGTVNEKQYEAISNMKKSNQELLDLVYMLLDSYKIKDTGVVLDKQEINLTQLISDTVDEMKPIATKSGIEIIFEKKGELNFSVDLLMLKRVLKNLIQNSITYSDTRNGIEVLLEETKDCVEIKIIDFGKGIPKEDLEKIFNKYFSTANKFRKVGTGLGLYLSQQIVIAHGGRISVKSDENSKTEFCISLLKTVV